MMGSEPPDSKILRKQASRTRGTPRTWSP